MSRSNKIFVILVILAACVGCDQATKRLARLALKEAPARSFLHNIFRLEYAENSGAFLGFGASLPDWERWLLLTVASSAILAVLLLFILIRKDLRPIDIYGYTLILAGGVSNMIDRILAGVVIDFMNIGFGNVRTGIFNVADMAITAGLCVILYAHIAHSHRPARTVIDRR